MKKTICQKCMKYHCTKCGECIKCGIDNKCHALVFIENMENKKCPNCGSTSLYSDLFGYANPLCPEFCTIIKFPL